MYFVAMRMCASEIPTCRKHLNNADPFHRNYYIHGTPHDIEEPWIRIIMFKILKPTYPKYIISTV